jgi:ATP synthase subunit 6
LKKKKMKAGRFRSPLEQFEVVSLVPRRLGSRDRSLTNASRRMVLTASRRVGRSHRVLTAGNGTRVPNRWQSRREGVHNRVLSMITQTIGVSGQGFFPFVYTLFTFVLGMNLLGLVPYSYTVTSQLVVTRTRARAVWLGKRRVGFRRHGRKLFGRFLPAGTPFPMIPLRVPLERLGFMITCISLSVRLFANMMAGHILLKVIAGFAWTMMAAGGRMYVAHFIPMVVLFRLLALETGVAFVQAYVFALLTCIYMTDVVHGGH